MTEKELQDKKYELLEKCVPHLTAINSFINNYRKFGVDAQVKVSVCEGHLIVDIHAETETTYAKMLAARLGTPQEVE